MIKFQNYAKSKLFPAILPVVFGLLSANACGNNSDHHKSNAQPQVKVALKAGEILKNTKEASTSPVVTIAAADEKSPEIKPKVEEASAPVAPIVAIAPSTPVGGSEKASDISKPEDAPKDVEAETPNDLCVLGRMTVKDEQTIQVKEKCKALTFESISVVEGGHLKIAAGVTLDCIGKTPGDGIYVDANSSLEAIGTKDQWIQINRDKDLAPMVFDLQGNYTFLYADYSNETFKPMESKGNKTDKKSSVD